MTPSGASGHNCCTSPDPTLGVGGGGGGGGGLPQFSPWGSGSPARLLLLPQDIFFRSSFGLPSHFPLLSWGCIPVPVLSGLVTLLGGFLSNDSTTYNGFFYFLKRSSSGLLLVSRPTSHFPCGVAFRCLSCLVLSRCLMEAS